MAPNATGLTTDTTTSDANAASTATRLTTQALGSNVVLNPGFETGSLSTVDLVRHGERSSRFYPRGCIAEATAS